MQFEPDTGTQVYRFVVSPRGSRDPRSAGLLTDCNALGLTEITSLTCSDLYFIEGRLDKSSLKRLAYELLSDALTQDVEWACLSQSNPEFHPAAGEYLVEVALRPGVTDPVAEQIVRAADELGIEGIRRASTGQRYILGGPDCTPTHAEQAARRLLANAVIQRYSLGEIQPAFPVAAPASAATETLPIRELSPDQLLALSEKRRAALDLQEMTAIQEYCRAEGRDLSDVEFEMIAQTWSEHCVHKTFKALVDVQEADGSHTQIDNIMKTYLRAATDEIAAPWVLSAFLDNAGIVEFDGKNEISIKVETHNHPSAIEPFGGANTGTGGVIRDVLGVSAKPIAATDVLCFGPQDLPLADLPEGVLHPRRIFSGVVAGVQDYGNKIGIPTVSGAILFDPGFTANPLVFCGCLGIAPKGSHPRGPQAGDRVIVLGGRTGRDGLRGATFSSMTMDAQTGEVSGASVQIGNPIVEKGLIEVIMRGRDRKLYHAITDCGAGGLSSAVGEMAAEIGADIDLQHVRLKYPGLTPWEIWLSEAQERMVLAVPEASLPKLQELCAVFEVELTDIGVFTGNGRLTIRYGSETVLDLSMHFLHEGIPQRKLKAVIAKPQPPKIESAQTSPHKQDYNSILLKLLSHPNIASKEHAVRIYDHEIQGGMVIKPLTGAQNDGPSDAPILKPLGSADVSALAIGAGINTEYGKLDAYRMAASVIDEAVRNAVAAGADPDRIAILDNFCWGNPLDPLTLGSLVEAVRGCRDAALLHKAPFISGKDSFNNEYLGSDGKRHAIPPTLLITSLGLLEDWQNAVTMDLKEPGNPLYLIGEFEPVMGGSHYALVNGVSPSGTVPGMSMHAPQVYRRFYQAVRAGYVSACHDLSEGGLAVAAAEMCIGGRLGLALQPPTDFHDTPIRWLFGETNGCLLVEVKADHTSDVENLFNDLPLIRLGAVTQAQSLTAGSWLDIPIQALVDAWQRTP